jgi:hypothetical protein
VLHWYQSRFLFFVQGRMASHASIDVDMDSSFEEALEKSIMF